MTLTLLHTAEVHRAAFDALAARIAPEAKLTHHVRADWLERAQDGVDDTLRAEIAKAIAAAPGPVLCTCTTLGPQAVEAGAIRIDAPMMQAAAKIAAKAQGSIVMAYCLPSTLAPSAALLDAALEAEGHKAKVHALSLAQFWPLFEAGEDEAFAAVIATAIRENLSAVPGAACVVLAQASMARAAPMLSGLPIPVLASPEMALRAALSQA
ncbi:hypothetical protein KUD11_05155 [Roseovarius sp. LXJ103]|uniref:hypothetical protein n=1 Tax=Roseovarius carneus TaxID=2853164 RepID=UPI000D61A14C|nr:hypothetical protein [Roseovarius carneus]MBZ8118031.1 hypothetical protein [Roseovarius carneus]PWE36223.1 hypothetical protein DD563_09810 [Pelagicola sp. LXJ1103]